MNTRAQSASLLGLAMPFIVCMPLSDGDIEPEDSLHLVGRYAAAPVPEPSTTTIKYLTFQKPNGTTGVQSITGVGFEGVALLLWSDRQASVGVTDGAQWSVGMTDGTVQVTRFINHPDNESSTTSAQSERTNRIVYMTNATSGATPTVQAQASFAGFTADGFDLDWLTNDSTQSIFHALVLGGIQASVESVKITVNSGASIDRTGVGFQPDCFVVLGGAADEFGTGDYNLGAPFGSIHGFGFSNAVQNECGWTLGRGTAGAADCYRGQHTNRAFSARLANLAGATELCGGSITAILSDGFRILRQAGTTTHQPLQHVMCLKGLQFSMGAITTPASPDDVTVSLDFEPSAVILQTHGLSAATGDGMGLAVGIWHDGTEGGTWIGGTDNTNPSVYARATYNDSTLKSFTPSATGSASTLVCDATISTVNPTGFTVDFATVPASSIQVLYLALAPTTEDASTPLSGINPVQGDPVGAIHFAFLRLGVDHYFAADTLIRDDAADFEGKKAATLVSVSANERELSREGYTGSTFTVVVNDTPDPVTGERLWRALWNTHTLENMLIEIYRVDAPYGRIVGEPFRLMAGVVKNGGFKTRRGFTFEFECVDLLGDRFANPRNQPQIPTFRLTVEDIVNLLDPTKGKYTPRVLGYALEPGVGAVPMLPLIENVNLQDLLGGGAADVDVDVWLLSEGAVYDIPQGYYNPTVWGEETEVLTGDLIRPTPDGENGHVFRATTDGTTGATEPTWPTSGTVSDGSVTWEEAGADDPLARYPIPVTAYSDLLTHPHAPNWLTATGLSTQYVDYTLIATGLRRFTPVFTAHNHRFGEAIREGRITLMFDVIGAMEEPDDGVPILHFTQLIMRLLLDYVFTPTDLTTYGDIPVYQALTGDYSIFDTETADAAEAFGDELGGLIGGFVLAADGNQRGLWDWIGAMLRGGMLRMGPNRHGQLMFARKDVTAEPVVTFRGALHISDSEYVTDGSRRVNHLYFRYGPRYANPFAGSPAPEEGAPLPEQDDEFGWQSGLLEIKNQDAIDALWDTHAAILPTRNLDIEVTRDAATAAIVATEELDYGTGPGPAYHGTTLFSITGPWELLTKFDINGKTRELGDVIGIIDEEGPTEDGETLLRGWITKIRIDPERDLVTLSGEILPD